ncbi:BQ5605_C008g05378 [Microbotryum silenes-dioicae]|uniref:BQ5605_C008g05378 protein n=1 Tax=Microbotryum silenes-dioicae TaxID=796604 RepID=A0A2X0PF79_9BASI|nr:BQ5605_C008g05378 [Microbotryum silenes-dioicae]
MVAFKEMLPERNKQYGALAQRYPHFGSLDRAVTTAAPLEIGSLICFGLKLGSWRSNCLCRRSAVHRNYSVRYIYSKMTTARSRRWFYFQNVVAQELRLIKKACFSTHLIDGTMPFRMICGRQVIDSLGVPKTTYSLTTDLTSCYSDVRIISTSAQAEEQYAALRSQKGSLTTKQRASQQSKEGLFEAWSHAQHQPKRRAPQATFDRPPRARKRSERVFKAF